MDENIVNEAEFTETENDNTTEKMQEKPNESTKSKLSDRIADYLGFIFGILMTTVCAAVTFAFFITFIPSIHFTFTLFLKCWSGMISFSIIKGLIKFPT